MVTKSMIEAATTEFKKALVDYCGETAEEALSAESAAVVTKGLQHASAEGCKAAFRTYLELHEEQRDVICEDGEAFRFKYESEKDFLTLWGPVRVSRRLYQNADDESYIPIDAAWGMVKEWMTIEVREALAFSCAHLTPEETHQLLEKTAQFHPHPTQIKRAVESIGKAIERHRETLDTAIREAETAPEQTAVLVASMDGANVLLNEPGAKCGRPSERPTGEEGKRTGATAYRNAMVGSFSCYGAPEEAENGEMKIPRLFSRYTAQMPEERALAFKEDFEAELAALEAKLPEDVVRVLLCDGARSIWFYAGQSERLREYLKLLDFHHATEHLSRAAEAIFGKGSEAATAWFEKYRHKLLHEEDGAVRVLHSMDYYAKKGRLSKSRREALRVERTFFNRNKGLMTYAEFRRRGLPIGSGPVEAACKTLVKARLCRSGMRWSREGGQRILDLRTYVKSNRWDAMWDGYKKLNKAA